jgi:hypothetical protein
MSSAVPMVIGSSRLFKRHMCQAALVADCTRQSRIESGTLEHNYCNIYSFTYLFYYFRGRDTDLQHLLGYAIGKITTCHHDL